MDEMIIATPQQVAQEIRTDLLEKRKLKMADVARLMGTSPQNLSGLLKGRARYRIKTANAFHRLFGYSLDYLLEGKGALYETAQGEEITIGSEISGDIRAITDPFGSFLPDSEDLTPRQALLNDYAKKLTPIFRKVVDCFPGGKLDFFNIDTSEFDAHDGTEMTIYRYIAFTEHLIRQVLRPENILKELAELPSEQREKEG